MGEVRKRSLGGLVWSAMVVVATGCHSFEYVSVEDRTLAEAILHTQAFHAPMTIEVDANIAKACSVVEREESPRAWIALRDAGSAALETITFTNGTSGCALKPVGTSARTGRTGAWKITASGRWKIPVGMYALNSTGTFESIAMDRSAISSGRIVFPWTFYPFVKMEQVVLAQTTAAEQGMKGQATAELARTSDGWKVVSLEMNALQPR